MPTASLDFPLSDRARSIDVSGIRRVFELGARLEDPINLSIGQPDFPVANALKQAAIDAINADQNGYTLTQGSPQLLAAIANHLAGDIGWTIDGQRHGAFVTSGTSGGLLLAFLAVLNPGDEVIIPDPYFVIYPAHATLAGATAVRCETYPDFRMTAERIERLFTDRTKMVLINSPGNPSGVVLSGQDVREIAELCDRRGIVLLTDEIYDEFTFADAQEQGRCPSPARFSDRCVLIRGFGKTYGCTGWRLGYAAGPQPIIEQMMKLQQYTFVCAPSIAQAGVVKAFDIDVRPLVARYAQRRDRVLAALEPHTEVARPGGAFYAYFEVPPRLGVTATQFVEQAIERNVLVIPGGVFSDRDTHVRLSYAVADDRLDQGLAVLADLLAD